MMTSTIQAAAALASLEEDPEVIVVGDDVNPLQAAVLALGRPGVVLKVGMVAFKVAVVAVAAVSTWGSQYCTRRLRSQVYILQVESV